MKSTEDLIAAYLSGNASAEECAGLEAWLLVDENKNIFHQYREIWEASASVKQVVIPDTYLAWAIQGK